MNKFKTKLSFISQDRSGREVFIKDSTRFESEGVSTGYGPPNNPRATSILSYYISVSRMFDSVEEVFRLEDGMLGMPSISDFSKGEVLRLTTDIFESDPSKCSSQIFRDGVLDINAYTEFLGLSNVTIEKGTNFIYGGDFTEVFKADSVIVDGVIYHIDKEVDNNAGTVLYIIGEFEDDATEFTIAYRSNVKALLTSMSESYHDYACKVLSNSIDSPEWSKVNTAASFRRAAQGLFRQEPADLYAANDLVESNFKLLKKYAI